MNRIDEYSKAYVEHVMDIAPLQDYIRSAYQSGFRTALNEVLNDLSDCLSEETIEDVKYYFTGKLDKK